MAAQLRLPSVASPRLPAQRRNVRAAAAVSGEVRAFARVDHPRRVTRRPSPRCGPGADLDVSGPNRSPLRRARVPGARGRVGTSHCVLCARSGQPGKLAPSLAPLRPPTIAGAPTGRGLRCPRSR